MDDRVVTFSPDSIRGNIIHKSLIWHGFKSECFTKLYETEASIIRSKPTLLIVDTVDCFTKAMLFLKTLAQNQPDLRVVKMIESHKIPDLNRHGISNRDCYPEPFEPEVLMEDVILLMERLKNLDQASTVEEALVEIKTGLPEQKESEKTGATDENMFDHSLPPFFREPEKTWFEKLFLRIKGILD
ncbi:MAG: hypothetical protein OMM_09252, partial [Candidatus Magnetoglobus multicellularis str. Araruama]